MGESQNLPETQVYQQQVLPAASGKPCRTPAGPVVLRLTFVKHQKVLVTDTISL